MANNKPLDYYFILQVPRNASREEIRANYREIMMECDPRNKDSMLSSDTLKQMKIWANLATEAYRTLIDETKRQKYDRAYEKELAKEEAEKKKEAAHLAKRGAHTKEKSSSSRKYQGAHLPKAKTPSNVNGATAVANNPSTSAIEYVVNAATKTVDATRNLAKDYKETRKEEQANAFGVRHNNLDDEIYRNYPDGPYSSYKEAVFQICRGTVHINEEVLYQMSRLKYRENEGPQKYVLRNRKLIGIMLTATVLLGAHGISQIREEALPPEPPAIEEVLPQEEKVYTLNNYHTVQEGEYLALYSDSSHTSIDEIMEKNGLDSTTIHPGDRIMIPYQIKESDLHLYTQRVSWGPGTLTEGFAKDYETDLATIALLNQDNITERTNLKGQFIGYDSSNNTIMVPRFLTLREYKDMTAESRTSHPTTK